MRRIKPIKPYDPGAAQAALDAMEAETQKVEAEGVAKGLKLYDPPARRERKPFQAGPPEIEGSGTDHHCLECQWFQYTRAFNSICTRPGQFTTSGISGRVPMEEACDCFHPGSETHRRAIHAARAAIAAQRARADERLAEENRRCKRAPFTHGGDVF